MPYFRQKRPTKLTFTFCRSKISDIPWGGGLWAGGICHPKHSTSTKQIITTAGIALVKAAAVVVEELLEDNLHPGEVGVVELLELRNPGNDMEQVLPLSLLPS